MILFCLPYAGASATIYNCWRKHLDKNIQLLPIEYPGRGTKYGDPYFRDMDNAVELIIDEINNEVKNSEYAIFGHSLGAGITYFILKSLKERNLTFPKHAIISGIKPPHLHARKNISDYSHEDFVELIKSFEGTPAELFDDPDLTDFFIPILKNDFILIDSSYTEIPGVFPSLNVPLSIFIGKQEDIDYSEAIEWSCYTNQHIRVHEFDGGHFFVNSSRVQVIKTINQILCSETD